MLYEFYCEVCDKKSEPLTLDAAKSELNTHLYERHDLVPLTVMAGLLPGFEGKSAGFKPVDSDKTTLPSPGK